MTTIRIRSETHVALKRLAKTAGTSMQDVLSKAVESWRRRAYMEGLAADYAAMRRDPKGSQDFDRENAIWDRTSSDGLEGR